MTVPIPKRIAKLPTDEKGRPVPWFVHWEDGKPDFRVVGKGKIEDAWRFRKCWVCGETLGRLTAFVIGPMCAINRVSAEPPSHRDCATFSAQACPFLSTPRMHRNEKNLPGEIQGKAAGIGLKRNPGVTMIWVTQLYWPIDAGNGSVFRIGDPHEVQWFREGRAATRTEILESIDSGLPYLRELAVEDGPGALEELEKMHQAALSLLPA